MTYCFTRTDAMLLVLIISAFTLCTANPFHKYPFVFLLDVGNEELGKSNTEQIKVTVPGGIIAFKYPANGKGDVIGHVRVTGIDFGVDLKANIVEGGPGYRYVVLVLMGAPGTQYDAVVTIQTLDEDTKLDNSTKIPNNGYKVKEDDANDSAEDFSDKTDQKLIYREKTNADMTQTNSNSFSYINENIDNEDSHEYTPDDDSNDDIDGEKADIRQLSTYSYEQKENINIENSQDNNLDNENYLDERSDEIQDAVDEDNDEDEIDKIINNSVSNLNTNHVSVVPLNKVADGGKYDAFQPRFFGDLIVYPQGAILQGQRTIDSAIDDDNDYTVRFNRDKDSNNNIDISSIDY